MSDLLKVSSNPHIRSPYKSSQIMLMVLAALLPASAFGVWNFGLNAFIIIIISVASSVATEYIYERLMHKKITINDYSAAVTGLLLALNLPATVPWWLPIIGSVFAVLIVNNYLEAWDKIL